MSIQQIPQVNLNVKGQVIGKGMIELKLVLDFPQHVVTDRLYKVRKRVGSKKKSAL